MLLIYRLFACLWCTVVAAIQFADKGFYVLKYYTVWYVLAAWLPECSFDMHRWLMLQQITAY